MSSMKYQPNSREVAWIADPLVRVPDDLTITQLLLDGETATSFRPKRPEGVPWLIEDATGRSVGLEEVSVTLRSYASELEHWSLS
jgi:4-coumarate--CoA ligase